MGMSESRRTWNYRLLGVASGFLCWLVIVLLQHFGAFRSQDLVLGDVRYALRGERRASDSIAIVGIDEATIGALGGRWPLSRANYALLIKVLERGGASAIGLDLQFPMDESHGDRPNLLLAQIEGSFPNVAQAVYFSPEESPGDPPPSPDALAALARHGIDDRGLGVPEARFASLPFDELAVSAPAMGHVSVAVDPDGAIRRVPLLVRFQNRIYPSLAVSLYGLAHAETTLVSAGASHSRIELRWANGTELTFPVGQDRTTAIDFAGGRDAFTNVTSMLQILQWDKAGDLARVREAVQGRIVLVGVTTSDDLAATPYDAATPLVFVHANVIDDIVQGRFLSPVPDVAYMTALAIIALGFGLVTATAAIPIAARGTVLLAVLIAGLNLALFTWAGWDAPIVASLILPAATYGLVASVRYVFLQQHATKGEQEIREGRQKQQEFFPEGLVGKELSHYLIEGRIGPGGMGEVYRGKDLRLGRKVAIKVMHGGALADDDAKRRFRREARMLSKINHPGIASIYEFDTVDGLDFIAMEYVPGHPLSNVLMGGPLPEAHAVDIGRQVSEALAAAHAKGIVHRDMKPANVMLLPDGTAKLLDFGIALVIFQSPSSTTDSGRLTEKGSAVGTLHYLPPEVIDGGTADIRSDVYGVGLLLYEMTTGKTPFLGGSPRQVMWQIVTEPLPDCRKLNPRLSEEAAAVIRACTQKDPRSRPQSARELAKLLAACQGTEEIRL